MFTLKEKAEQTQIPELFELYYKTAEVYKGLIKTIQELAKAYQEHLKEAQKFDLEQWARLEKIKAAATMLQQDLIKEQGEFIAFIDNQVKYLESKKN